MYVCCPHCEWRSGIKSREEARPLFAAHANAHVVHFGRQLDEFGADGFAYCSACIGKTPGHRPCFHVDCLCACSNPGPRC